MSQYLQEIRRCGQPSFATFYSNRDIGNNLPEIKEDIINYCKKLFFLPKESTFICHLF